jgi:hypothetical protein
MAVRRQQCQYRDSGQQQAHAIISSDKAAH